MSRAEEQHQHQHQQQQHQQQQQQQHQQLQLQHHQQVHHQSRYPTHEYVHCSYEKEVVCDQANPLEQPEPQQPQQQQQQPQQQPSHHCQQQRKHSHSPHHSRHTSPHSHSHHHHSHHRSHRRRRQGSGSLPGAHQASSGNPAAGVRPSICTSRRHRSVTELSSHNCQDPACSDREVQEILVRKTCCNTATNSSSRTELAQCFAEDLYGSSRRPSSCCTSSDYCYQTDSTSLYGSRSSLSRNNSIKSASALVKKHQHRSQRSLLPEHRHPSYTSISLRGLNASRPNSQLGSLTSIFDRAKNMEGPEPGCSLERQSSKGALSSTELPEYACSPSPIRWSFLADGRSPTELEGAVGGEAAEKEAKEDELDAWQVPEPEPEKKPCRKITSTSTTINSETCWKSTTSIYDEGPSTSAAAARKRRGSKGSRGSRGSRGSGNNYHCEFEEEATTTVMFHQDAGDSYNNCCSNNYNYIQCNSYLDQDLQITSEDIHQYLSKGDATASDILNNSKNYPFQPSNALEFQYKNNFQQGQNLNNNNTNTTNTASSDAAECFQSYQRASSKETNLNQSSTEQLSPTNINLSTSSNNINIVFSSSLERNANEVKFINNRGGAGSSEVGCEGHHAGYLPYTYPSYDYTNMSGNSHFEKPLGIDELPKEFAGAPGYASVGGGGASTASEHSSSLPSPPPLTHHQQLHHFESFDAASEHTLLAQPMSPGSPLSGSVNPAGDDDFVQMHHYHHSTASPHHSHAHSHAHHPHHQHSQHSQHPQHSHHQHSHHACDLAEEQFRLGSALKRVRKRARKYTDFLRKK